MNVQERINKISDYFVSMNVVANDNVIYVLVRFDKGWTCSELTEVNFNVKTTIVADQPYHYYFFSTMDVGFDRIFDAIEFNIRLNTETQEKVNLLRQKIEELKNIFEVEDIKTLSTLEFKYKKKKVRTLKQKDNVVNIESTDDIDEDNKINNTDNYDE